MRGYYRWRQRRYIGANQPFQLFVVFTKLIKQLLPGLYAFRRYEGVCTGDEFWSFGINYNVPWIILGSLLSVRMCFSSIG